MEFKKIFIVLILGFILGIAIFYLSFNQRTAKTEKEIAYLKIANKQLEERIEESIEALTSQDSNTIKENAGSYLKKVKILLYGDQNHNEIKDNEAPFIIYVEGAASNVKDNFLYLIVDDGNALWIQPGLGPNLDGEFARNCYLGIKDDPNSLNKWYRVFAVITDKKYKPYENLDMKTVKAESKKIKLYRTRT